MLVEKYLDKKTVPDIIAVLNKGIQMKKKLLRSKDYKTKQFDSPLQKHLYDMKMHYKYLKNKNIQK